LIIKSSEPSLRTIERTKTATPETKPTARPIGDIPVSQFKESKTLDKYIRNVGAMNKKTAYEYYIRLTTFQGFLINNYKVNLDDIITNLNEGIEDPYEILSGYVAYLQTGYNISALTLKIRIITAKNFLEYCDVDISPRKFKLKVKIPRVVRQNKEALSKEDISNVASWDRNACY
jgi:predicted transport protein